MGAKRLILLAACISLVALWGCSSSMDSAGGGNGGDTDSGNSLLDRIDAAGDYVGASRCIECHQGFSWSAEEVNTYLGIIGGNPRNPHVFHSDSINAESDDDCLECHDPLGDGQLVEGEIPGADVPAEGLAAVTCEVCHGSGINHYGIGPIPNPTPDYAWSDPDIDGYYGCGNCHNVNYSHGNPEAQSIYEDYVGGAHNRGYDNHNERICSKCHTDEGARLYVNVDTVSGLETIVSAVPSPNSSAQCRTCHNAHNPYELLEEEISSRSLGTIESAEYATCTNCHQDHNAAVGTALYTLSGSTSTDGASLDGDLIYHATRITRIITDTHYDDPATTNIIEGYTMDPANERVCRDCHNVHSANIDINEEWAKSAHGGNILGQKEDAETGNEDIAETIAVKAAGVTSATGDAWLHYDWDKSFKADGTDAGTDPDKDRVDCQRCHTSTGVKNFLTSPAAYDPAKNDFSHLEGWSGTTTGTIATPSTWGVTTSSGQNEMLYCWACHSDNAGTLRNPGPISETYSGSPTGSPSVVIVYPAAGDSNVCMACHLGREVGEVIFVSTGTFTKLSFINSHYLAAGATLFKESGYEYTGPSYANLGTYAHDMINLNIAGEGLGPCVSCHMGSGTADHTFEVVTKNVSDEITAINSNVCADCHGALTAPVLQAYKAGYEAALEVLDEALENVGLHFYESYPYFFTAPYNTGYTEVGACTDNLSVLNWQDGGTINYAWNGSNCTTAATVGVAGTAGTGKGRMGAAFNFNLLAHDSGAFAHNSHYTKLLIFDAIDYLDNNTLNGTIDLTGHADAAAYLKPGYGNIAAVARP